jgi:butyryl-CoA dehydrogenase
MPPAADMTDGLDDARAFADSVAGVLDRRPRAAGTWAPGAVAAAAPPEVGAALDDLGWDSLAADPALAACAGLGALELGRRLESVHHVDRLLGGSPVAQGLVRGLGPERVVVTCEGGEPRRRLVLRDDPCPSAEGLDVRRVLELGQALPGPDGPWPIALGAWLSAGVGYLAGVGQGALDLTVEYVRQRRAFGATLAALAPVQQLLADAATAVRGVTLLAGASAGGDALAHAGPSVAQACAACQQVTGALGYTLEYPLHRYTQRARALASWNDALLDELLP